MTAQAIPHSDIPPGIELKEHQKKHYTIIKLFFKNRLTYDELSIITGYERKYISRIINQELLNIEEIKDLSTLPRLKRKAPEPEDIYNEWVKRNYCMPQNLADSFEIPKEEIKDIIHSYVNESMKNRIAYVIS